MKTASRLITSLFAIAMMGCYLNDDFHEKNDPGSLQADNRIYSITDFDRLEAGDALHLTVTQGTGFSVTASGDTRNLDDLVVKKEGTTLVLRFNESRSRQYTTFIEIVMPDIAGFDFSGAMNGIIHTFTATASVDLSVSGASITKFDIHTPQVSMSVTGASKLELSGTADRIDGTISGASKVEAFDLPVSEAHLNLSGASEVKINASDLLSASLSGASKLSYQGDPQLQTSTTGASSITKK